MGTGNINDTRPIGELLREMFEVYSLKNKMGEVELSKLWKELLGSATVKHTKNIFFRDDVLIVELDSAVLRSELFLTKEKILKTVNAKFGSGTVKDIIFR
ncbi:MAG: DUF721 domain-containing protein [Bacteroidetes bacterium]|nr:DUF721 domain-containing protein [Bacteroidota bacterium]